MRSSLIDRRTALERRPGMTLLLFSLEKAGQESVTEPVHVLQKISMFESFESSTDLEVQNYVSKIILGTHPADHKERSLEL